MGRDQDVHLGYSRVFACIPTMFAVVLAAGIWVSDARADDKPGSASRAKDEAEALSLHQRSGKLINERRYAEAIPFARRALELTEKIHGPVHRNVSADLITLAELYQTQGDFLNAEFMIVRAIEIDKKLHGPMHPEVAIDLSSLAEVYRRKEDRAGAAKLFREALSMLYASKDYGAYLGHIATVHHRLGVLLFELQQRSEAMTELLKAEQIYEVTDRRRAIEVLVVMANHARADGNHARAETFLGRAKQLGAQ